MTKIELRQFSLAFKLKIVKYYESLQDDRPIREKSMGFVCNVNTLAENNPPVSTRVKRKRRTKAQMIAYWAELARLADD